MDNEKTEVIITKENSDYMVEVGGVHLHNVTDYQLTTSAHGKTELTLKMHLSNGSQIFATSTNKPPIGVCDDIDLIFEGVTTYP